MFLHVHDHQHRHKFCSQQFFFGNFHIFCKHSHRQCCRDTLVTTAAECHYGTVTAAHAEVRRCCRVTSYHCYYVFCQKTFIQQILNGRAYAESIFLFHADFCNFHIDIDSLSDKAQFFHINFICPVIKFFKAVFCYIKFACFFGSNKFCCALVHQNFTILFTEYHVVMGILCNGMRYTCCIRSSAFNVKAAALQHFYAHHTFRYHFFRLHNMFGFDIGTDFHSIAWLGQKRAQSTCQFNAICTCIGDLHAICVFENVGRDHHIQLFCRILQIFACSGNRQRDRYGFCTAHAGFHFGFDCIYYYVHIHNSSSYILYIRKNENYYLILYIARIVPKQKPSKSDGFFSINSHL